MTVVELGPEDVTRYLKLRTDGLRTNPEAFRVTVRDDKALTEAAWRDRLARDFVVGVSPDETLVGIGGLSRFVGEKLSHKGLIWGMYVAPEARGSGAADLIMTALLGHAQSRFRQVQLTVMADNARARRFYERHGFAVYGVEPDSVRRDGEVFAEALMWRRLQS